jgi:hypothetical protein
MPQNKYKVSRYGPSKAPSSQVFAAALNSTTFSSLRGVALSEQGTDTKTKELWLMPEEKKTH